jgi:glutamine amidotransferase
VIGIVDYGLGNIQAFANIYKRLNIPVQVVRTGEELRGVERIILPGVGAFDWAMSRLNASGMRETLDRMVQVERKPVLGICVGMQMMARRSEEGVLPGLGWIAGEVLRFKKQREQEPLQLPHMGWNDVAPTAAVPLFEGLESDARFYFLHSYFVSTDSDTAVLARTLYNAEFASAVCTDNVIGVQFHPEKSHTWGTRLLENFARS